MTRRRPLLALAAATLVLALTGCTNSPYEDCVDQARESWDSMKKSQANNGQDVGSVGSMIEDLDAYIVEQCGLDPDD